MTRLLLYLAIIFAAAGKVSGQYNNGFREDWVYVCVPPGGGGSRIIAYEEDSGWPAVNPWHYGAWYSLTFAGTADDDARLFVTKPDPYWGGGQSSYDVMVAEMDSNGSVINYTWVSTLLGLGSPGPTSIGGDVVAKTIRYSSYHNSLFLSVVTEYKSGLTSPATVYEIDMGLTTILNTYTGPNVKSTLGAIAINGPTLYMTGTGLNDPGWKKGDVIAFDTSDGSSSSYTTLIDGASLGDVHYLCPYHVIYRGINNPDRRPTILLLMMGLTDDYEFQLEFYLDQTDDDGNLVKRGEPFQLKRGSGGDLDKVCKTVWVTDSKNDGGHMQGLKLDDTFFDPSSSGTSTDSTSPGVGPPVHLYPPIIEEVLPDPEIVHTGTEYIKQVILSQGSPPITWLLVQGPAGAQIDNDGLTNGLVYGWIPDVNDIGGIFTFEVQASNAEDSDTDAWEVEVFSKADFDRDLDVDQEDFGYFQACYSGSGNNYEPGCDRASLDLDSDVDQEDFILFQECMSGANQLPGC